MVWVGVAVGLFAAYKIYRRTSAEKADLKSKFADVVAGTKRALGVLPPDLKERAKVEMEAEQDHSTKVAVAVAKVKKV